MAFVKRNTIVLFIVVFLLAVFGWAGWANWMYHHQQAERRAALAQKESETAPYANAPDTGDIAGIPSPLVDKPAPAFTLQTVDGRKVSLADYKGKALLLNFWATWCGPCREELPMLTRLSKDYAPRHVRFIAASADENKDRAKVARFVHDHDLGMDVWVGANLDMLDSAKLGNELPATLILDADGNIITRIKGEAREKDVRDALDWILGGEKGAAPPAVVTHY